MGNRLPIILPLTAALALAVLLVVLIFLQSGRGGGDSAAAPPLPKASAMPEGAPLRSDLGKSDETIFGSPTDPDPKARPKRERFEHRGRLIRWDLGELPEGWDEEVAMRLHDLFSALEYDHLSIGEVQERVERALKEMEEYLASLGPEAIPTLATILHAEPDFVCRRKVFEALGNLGPRSEAATYALRDFYFERQEDPANRSELVNLIRAMGHLKNDTSFEFLSEMSVQDEHRPYRDNFIQALGEHPRRAEAVDIFVDAMGNDTAFRVRNHSAQALGKVRSPETLPSLYDAFDRERVWYAQQTILGTIGKIGSIESLPFLEAQARDARVGGVRLSAGSAIRRIREQTSSPVARRVLEDLAQTETDPKVKSYFQRWAHE